MKANELMTGDIVRVAKDVSLPKGTIVSVRGIDADNIFKEKHLVGSATCLPINDKYKMVYGVWVEYLEPIPIIPEILEKNGFKKDAFTNLSPDYYLGNDEYSICVNLNSTCDKSKSIWIEKRSSRFIVSIEESRYSLDKKPLYVHQLQHALRLCGIEKEIIL